jgi:hypothetical protein
VHTYYPSIAGTDIQMMSAVFPFITIREFLLGMQRRLSADGGDYHHVYADGSREEDG